MPGTVPEASTVLVPEIEPNTVVVTVPGLGGTEVDVVVPGAVLEAGTELELEAGTLLVPTVDPVMVLMTVLDVGGRMEGTEVMMTVPSIVPDPGIVVVPATGPVTMLVTVPMSTGRVLVPMTEPLAVVVDIAGRDETLLAGGVTKVMTVSLPPIDSGGIVVKPVVEAVDVRVTGDVPTIVLAWVATYLSPEQRRKTGWYTTVTSAGGPWPRAKPAQ